MSSVPQSERCVCVRKRGRQLVAKAQRNNVEGEESKDTVDWLCRRLGHVASSHLLKLPLLSVRRAWGGCWSLGRVLGMKR